MSGSDGADDAGVTEGEPAITADTGGTGDGMAVFGNAEASG